VAAVGTRGIPSHYSGLETSCEGLYSALANRGHQMTVYCRRGHVTTGTSRYRGVELLRVPAARVRPLETLSHVAASLADAAARRRFDLIHMHAEAPGLFAPLLSMAGVPVVATIQGLDWQRAKWRGQGARLIRRAERALVRHAREIIVVSRSLQTYFREEYDRDTWYIPNGVEERERIPEPARLLGEWGLEEQGFIVYVGRLVPEKRIEDLISAFRSVNTSLRLVVVGEGGYTRGYAAHLREVAGKDPRVVFAGAQRGATLDALFQAASGYVLPSEMEGLPMSLLECMAAGTPAVVSDIAPHRELLDGVEGYDLFFPPGDVRSLAGRLSQLLGDPARYREVAERARFRVRESYGWASRAEATELVFQRAVEGPAREAIASPGPRIQRNGPPASS
jgi:glycosyltransferase involved in cell wall biosynthesis